MFAGLVATLRADPLTRQFEVDFGRDVASRNLKGLATRSDGRILPGPVFTDLTGPKLGEILWSLKPAGPDRFVVGSGPDGKVLEVTFQPKDNTYSFRELADVAETHAMALQPLAGGSLLVGTSPAAAIYLIKDGKPVARVPLPADSVFDFLALPDGDVLASTGSPGKIYRITPAKLAQAGLVEGKTPDEKSLPAQGVVLFGEVRDRNVRKLARLADGRVIAGSSPKGNVYAFDPTGGAPLMLQENRDAEVVDLLPTDDGGFYAGLVVTPGDVLRIARPGDPKDEGKDKEAKPGFVGRTSVVRFSTGGFPENIISKANIALYRLARHNDWLLLTAGEQGDAFGYDPVSRRSLTFAGSASAQLNDIAPLGNGRFLLLRNNAPGLALMSFAPAPARELETRRLDLGQSGEFGALRFARFRDIDPAAVKVEVRTNFGSDELEGWTPWTEMRLRDGAFRAEGQRGRYARFRLAVSGDAADFQIDKATLYTLPQNRRPTLGDFRIIAPNLGLIPSAEIPPSATTTLSQMIFPSARDGKDDGVEKHKTAFLNSQVVPMPGARIVYWSASDPDGDSLSYTFSIRAESSDTWTDLAVATTGNYVQFDTGGLAEGLFLTRLTVAETSPRPAIQRLSYTFETDNLMVDRTPPAIASTEIRRQDGKLLIAVAGADALSLLEGAEFALNNGEREVVLHPEDGILDEREERFVAELPEARCSGATSVEIVLHDAAGNSSSVRAALN